MKFLRNALLVLAALIGTVQSTQVAAQPSHWLKFKTAGRTIGGGGGPVDPPPAEGAADAALYGFNLSGAFWYAGYAAFSNAAAQAGSYPQSLAENRPSIAESDVADDGTIPVTPAAGMMIALNTLDRPGHYRARLLGTTSIIGSESTTNLTSTGVVDGYKTWEFDVAPGNYSVLHFAGNTSLTFLDVRETNRSTSEIYLPEYVAAVALYNHFRAMDWANVNNNYLSPITAANRSRPNAPVWKWGMVPFERIVDLAVAANVNLWQNVPYSADQSYVNALVDDTHARLPSGKYAIFERGNEALNPQFGFWGWATTAWMTTFGQTDTGNPNGNVQRTHALLHNTLMTQIEARAATIGASVGPTGRFRRALGNIADSYVGERSYTGGSSVHPHTDFVANAFYFGNDTHLNPTVTLDKDVVLDRMLGKTEALGQDVESVAAYHIQLRSLVESDGHELSIYEGQQHLRGIPDDDPLVPNVSVFRESITGDPKMRQAFNYSLFLWKTRARGPNGIYTVYVDYGKPSVFGSWALRQNYNSTSQRYSAYLDARAGVYPTIPLAIVNDPLSGSVGSLYNYDLTVRFGAGLGAARTFAYTANGAQRGLTPNLTTGALSGIPTSEGTVQGTFTASDSTGSVSKVISIPIAAGYAYDFDEDARLQGSTAQDLSLRGWTVAANRYYAQNGFVRIGSSGGYDTATKNLGSGKTRRMVIELPPASALTSATNYQGFGYYLFAPQSSKFLYVAIFTNPGDTTYGVQIQNTAGYVSNIGVSGGTVPHLVELRSTPEPGDATQATLQVYVDTVLVSTINDQPNDFDATAPVGFFGNSEPGKAVASRMAFAVDP